MRNLEKLEPFDPTSREHIDIKNRWLSYFHGDAYSEEMFQQYSAHVGNATGTEYTKADTKKWMEGQAWSSRTTDLKILNSGYDLFRDLPEIKIPLYIFAGRHDYLTPSPLAEEYYYYVEAPKKELIWFEDSAHYMIFAEPDKMARELGRIGEEVLGME